MAIKEIGVETGIEASREKPETEEITGLEELQDKEVITRVSTHIFTTTDVIIIVVSP